MSKIIYRPDGAWPSAGARATKMPLLTEQGNDVQFILPRLALQTAVR